MVPVSCPAPTTPHPALRATFSPGEKGSSSYIGSDLKVAILPWPIISIVVAVSQNGVIGVDNGLPWRLPSDLRRFKALTMGHPVVMGRRTFTSIGRPLPGRDNIVMSRGRNGHPGILDAFSIDEALAVARQCALKRACAEIMVIGGGEIYRSVLARTKRIYYTEVDAVVRGDTDFPLLPQSEWHEVSRESCKAGKGDSAAFTIRLIERN